MIDHRDLLTAVALSAAGLFAAALLLINSARELNEALRSPNKHGGLTS